MIEELSFALSDEPGSLHKILRVLATGGINVLAGLALGGTAADFAIVALVCDKPIDAANLLRQHGIHVQRRPVFSVAIEDSPGRLADLTGCLADAKINIRRLYHTEYSTRTGLHLTILSVDDYDEAIRALQERNFDVHIDLPPAR